jgi:hypothetical protein
VTRLKRHQIILAWMLTSACILWLASACSLSRSPASSIGSNKTPFLPATIAPTPAAVTSVPSSAPDESTSASPLNCTNQLTFVSDQTIPDGTKVQPGSGLDKRWEVKNSGTCNWDDSYHLKLIAGSNMGAAEEQALYPARSGSQVVIRIQFTAPTQAGDYRSAWQAVSPSGEPFGDPFFIEIVVGQ